MAIQSKIQAQPPELIDRLVRRLTPPLAREAVVGDLWERYQSPGQYLFEALHTLPFVIFSQMRRTARFSLLGLQTFILFACFGGFETSIRIVPVPHWAQAAVPTLAALIATMLRDAYRRKEHRTLHRAVLDTAVAAVCIAASQVMLAVLIAAGALGAGWVLPPPLIALGTLALPILFVLRAGTGLEETVAPAIHDGALSAQELGQDYRQFQRHVGWRNRAEVAALIAVIAVSTWFLLRFNPPVARAGWTTEFLCALLAIYLGISGSAHPMPSDPGFDSLRARYQAELRRQCQLRRLMWWFWLAPLFLGLIIKWLVRGYLQGQQLRAMLGIGMVIMLGVCVACLNLDRARQVQNRIGLLASLRERCAP